MIDDKIADIIKLASNYPVIKRVGVFGSYTREQQTIESDIDVLYDYDIKEDTSFVLDVLDYYDDIERGLKKFGLTVDYVSYKGVLESNNAAIRDSIISDVVWVYER